MFILTKRDFILISFLSKSESFIVIKLFLVVLGFWPKETIFFQADYFNYINLLICAKLSHLLALYTFSEPRINCKTTLCECHCDVKY